MTNLDKRQYINHWCDTIMCCGDCPINATEREAEFCGSHTEQNAPDEIIDEWFAALGGVDPTEVVEQSNPMDDVPLDNVDHPSHYNDGKIECIDAMVETQGVEAVKNFCVCNAFKYLWRHEHKNQTEDIKKAIWYLNKFIELEDSKV